jgi:uncharacterized protein YcbX
MAANEIVGSIDELWRFPVKSMKGERLEQADLTARGFSGDRAYALIDADTGKVVSAKSVRLFPNVLECRASFVEQPQSGREMPPVRITMPDGTSVTSDSNDINRVLSSFFGREVRLASVAPDDFTIEQYHPDLEDLDPQGHRNTVIDQKLGAALFAEVGLASPVPPGSFFDVFPVSVLTTSTLDRLNEIQPKSRFDRRRFRMNVIIKTGDFGFVENGWINHDLAIGNTARMNVAIPDPRCVMTTLAQDELPADTDILRTLVRYNKIQVGEMGKYPCCGAYCVVQSPGPIRIGDRVAIA